MATFVFLFSKIIYHFFYARQMVCPLKESRLPMCQPESLFLPFIKQLTILGCAHFPCTRSAIHSFSFPKRQVPRCKTPEEIVPLFVLMEHGIFSLLGCKELKADSFQVQWFPCPSLPLPLSFSCLLLLPTLFLSLFSTRSLWFWQGIKVAPPCGSSDPEMSLIHRVLPP